MYESAKERRIVNRANGTQLDVISGNPGAAHGGAPALVLADEIAQWQRTKVDAMLSALRTSLGKIPNARLVGIGTRAASKADAWERNIKAADYAQVYSAGKDDPPFQRCTWAKACPSLRASSIALFPDLVKAYKRARRDPALMQSFRALRLNQGVSDVLENYLLQPEAWERAEAARGRNSRVHAGYVLGH